LLGPRRTGAAIVYSNRWRRTAEVQAFFPARWQAPHGSRHRVEVLVAEVAGHDGDRNWKIARVLADAGHEWARPFLACSGGQHQDGDVLVVLDEIEDFLRFLPLPDHALRHDPGDAGRTRRKAVEHRIRLLIGFRPHDVGHAEPLLIAV